MYLFCENDDFPNSKYLLTTHNIHIFTVYVSLFASLRCNHVANTVTNNAGNIDALQLRTRDSQVRNVTGHCVNTVVTP